MAFREGLGRIASLGDDFARQHGIEPLSAGGGAQVAGSIESLISGIPDVGGLSPAPGLVDGRQGFQDPGARARSQSREFFKSITGTDPRVADFFRLGSGLRIREKKGGGFETFPEAVIKGNKITQRAGRELTGDEVAEAQGLSDERRTRLALFDPATDRGARTLSALARVARSGGRQEDLLEAFRGAQADTPAEIRERERREATDLRERERTEAAEIRKTEREEERTRRLAERVADRDFSREQAEANQEFRIALTRADRLERQGKRDEALTTERRAQINRLSSNIILQSQDRASRARAALPTGGSTAAEVQRLEQLAAAKATSVRRRRDHLFANPTQRFDPFTFQLGSDEDFFGPGFGPAPGAAPAPGDGLQAPSSDVRRLLAVAGVEEEDLAQRFLTELTGTQQSFGGRSLEQLAETAPGGLAGVIGQIEETKGLGRRTGAAVPGASQVPFSPVQSSVIDLAQDILAELIGRTGEGAEEFAGVDAEDLLREILGRELARRGSLTPGRAEPQRAFAATPGGPGPAPSPR